MHSISNITIKIFTAEQVKEINKKIRTLPEKKQLPGEASGNVIKRGKFSYVNVLSMMDLLHPWLYECQKINRSYFGYDIHWNFHLEKFNYNVYGKKGEYGWHVDGNPNSTPIDQKLTCILNLSEETYEGGDFYMTPKKEICEFNSGEAIVFTSLIAHKVTPVTKGERITLTYWAEGPAWK